MSYEIFKNDFMTCMNNTLNRQKHCPFKSCITLNKVNGVSTARFTSMPSMDGNGNFGVKAIYVNDETGECSETYVINGISINYSGITAKRCAYMARLIIELLKVSTDKVGFIGNGRINLAIKNEISPNLSIIHGARGREGKNQHLFGNCVVDTDFSKLNSCDIVFVCTNSYKKENLISYKEFHPKYIVVLDCGYTLNEDFRHNYPVYCDYPEQLINQYDEEFPFDIQKNIMYEPITSLANYVPNTACVYLHGCAINDLSMAKELLYD